LLQKVAVVEHCGRKRYLHSWKNVFSVLRQFICVFQIKTLKF
jgi:hypothetical protein